MRDRADAITSVTARRARLLARFSDAWSMGDLDALMDLMAADCTFRASVGPEPGETFVGRQAVREGFRRFLAAGSAGPAAHTVAEEPLVSDDFAVTRWVTSHPQRDGPAVVVCACDVLGFEGDLIKFKDTYRKVGGGSPTY
jgi:ketosteroid isomerase-like protein